MSEQNRLFQKPRRGATIERITDTEARSLASAFVDANHSYIRWADRPSRKMYWNLYEGEKHVGVFGLSSCFSHPKPVQDFMRAHNLEFNQIGHNIVYCLNGHEDRNSGSRYLALCRKDARFWWREKYGDELKAFQTSILPPRNGAVYLADNWTQIGITKGQTWETRSVSADQRGEKGVQTQIIDGQTYYFRRIPKETEPKLIFMRLA